MPVRHLQRGAMVAGAILAALLFFLGGAALRLLIGPISLGPFAGAIEDSLNNSVSGLVIRFDQAVLELSRQDGKVNLIILGTKVFDGRGHIVAQAPKADLDFDAAALISGHLALKRFALMDVQLTAVRYADGSLKLGFGPTGENADLLTVIRNALEQSADGGGSLDTFSIRNARMAFRDQNTGLFVVSPNVSLSVQDNRGIFDAALDADMEISGAPMRISARAALAPDGKPQHGTLMVQGLDLAALAANSPKFAALKPYALKTDVTARFAMGGDGNLTSTAFQVSGAGTVSPPALGRAFRIDHFAIDGVYDAPANRVTLDRFDIAGPDAAMNGKGQAHFAWKDGSLSRLAVQFSGQGIRFADKNLFTGPVAFRRAEVDADYDAATRKVTWNKLDVAGDAVTASLTGTATFKDGTSPAITASGTVQSLSVQQALAYWPMPVGSGARAWLADNVAQGQIGPVTVSAAIPAGALDTDQIPDDAMTVSFPVSGVEANYLRGLTPLTNARGQAVLSGDTFRLNVASATVGQLAVTGDVVIPDLHIPHAPGTFKAHVSGPVSDALRLIDLPPLGYTTRFDIDPAMTGGHVDADLDFVIPMRKDLDIDQIKLGVVAKTTDLRVPVGHRILDGGRADIGIDNTRLTATGSAVLSGVPVNFGWTEDFDPPTGVTTHVDVEAHLDDAARAKLGLAQPDWVHGPIATTLTLTGRRFNFSDGTVHADLTGASAVLAAFNLRKPAGDMAAASAKLHFDDNGGVAISDLDVTGKDLKVRGALALDPDGAIQKATFTQLRAGADNDFTLDITRNADGTRVFRVRGRSLDATKLFAHDDKGAAAGGAPAGTADFFSQPVTIDAALDKVALRDGQVLHDAMLNLAIGKDKHIDNFLLDATGPGKGDIKGRFTVAKNIRTLTIESDNGADFIRAFTGFSSLRGGKLMVRATFPPDVPHPPGRTPNPDYTGTVVMNDFTVVNQPFLARLFSAGSLDGPLRLLQGQGIAFTHLEAPFAARGEQITLRDGRANGPAIGLSFKGVIDRGNDTVNVDGSLVPVYGLNSLLGAVPVLGNLLVSKKGEGIIGLTYQVKGKLDEPSVLVNPLSVLTPGIFRRIFEFGLGTPAKPAPAKPDESGAATPAPSATPDANAGAGVDADAQNPPPNEP